jgi:methyl-accepting chemotaxis protein
MEEESSSRARVEESAAD